MERWEYCAKYLLILPYLKEREHWVDLALIGDNTGIFVFFVVTTY
jgi:hypothetical protein